jgi:nitrogen fixation protein
LIASPIAKVSVYTPNKDLKDPTIVVNRLSKHSSLVGETVICLLIKHSGIFRYEQLPRNVYKKISRTLKFFNTKEVMSEFTVFFTVNTEIMKTK